MPLLPSGSSLHINAPLTNISVAYQQGPLSRNFIAADAFPVVPVQKQGDLYWKYDKGDWFRGQAELRAPSTESAGGGWEVTTDSYFASVYAFHKDVDDQTRANADSPFNLDRDAALFVSQNLLQKRENLFTTRFLTAGVWAGATAVNGGAAGAGKDIIGAAATGAGSGAGNVVQWDRSGSNPVQDVKTQSYGMAEKTGYRPNTLILGPMVMQALMENTSIIDRIKYSERGIVSEALLASLFEVDRVLVTWAIQNTANQGATDVFGFMNGKSALLCYSAPNPGIQTPTAGYIFSWAGLLGAGAAGTRIKRFRMEAIESDRVEGEMAFDMKIVSPDLGVFFSGIVQ